MRIAVAQLPADTIIFEEDIPAASLGLDTEVVRFYTPIHATAEASCITNAVSVALSLEGMMQVTCGRCLEEFKVPIDKELTLYYQVTALDETIDLDPDIREEIILDYPLQPLCKSDCRGLCVTCGKNLNEGGCSCATTKEKTF